MKTVLFIEDESALQQSATQWLTDEGYRVVSALNGDDGLRLAKNENPDLILLDLILPKKDGFTVLKEIKGDPATASIPIIVLSNLGQDEDVERVLSLGATTYLVKTSYTLEEMAKKIQEVLGK